jgi:hypothetical protein
LDFIYTADSGINAPIYKKSKAYFQYVYSEYKQRAVGITEFNRQEAENDTINAQEGQSSTTEEEEDRQED